MKDALIETSMWFWGSSHQQWRIGVEKEYGTDATLRIELGMMGDLGRAHGRAFKKILHIGEGMSEFIRGIIFAPEIYLEGLVLE